ncbi:integration host factor subunit alpha [Geomonas subterranea]|uniref:integration host factor subunit alpha n=1 Tax=Geomonas subterranea TaxID=2847989 RepID=UPI001CD485F7|nr:integration host factor subunit alpha [Geomonas fuzhouensis]
MTKADIAGKMQEKMGFTVKQSLEIVDAVFDMMKDTLAQGHDLKISGFGSFKLTDKDARRGRNPQTGEEMTIEARRILTFKPGQTLKKRVNGEV